MFTQRILIVLALKLECSDNATYRMTCSLATVSRLVMISLFREYQSLVDRSINLDPTSAEFHLSYEPQARSRFNMMYCLCCDSEKEH